MAHETGFLHRSVLVGSMSHPYAVYVPPEYDPAVSWPVILFLHGSGESGADGLRQLSVGLGPATMRNRCEWPFVALFPQKPDHKALWTAFPAILDGVLEQSESEFELDHQRIYLTGISQGGHGAFMLARSMRWRFAAVAPLCGFPEPPAVKELEGLPVWAFHGEKDDIVAPDRAVETVQTLRQDGNDARIKLYPDLEHNCWDRAYQEEGLADWFLRHRRGLDSNR